jgi:hypothetical protein
MTLPAIGLVCCASLTTFAVSTMALAETALNDPRPVVYPVCYDFTCKTREVVSLSEPQWESLIRLFRDPSATPHDERLVIQQAVARMEQLTGLHTPTHRDLARNYTGENDALADLPGQMDCVDESINTTTYLKIFEQRGLLVHHRVLERAYRRALLNQHWAAQIEEIATGQRYVVDSWFFDNGQNPYVVHSDQWNDISPFRRARTARTQDREDARVAFRDKR